MIVNILITLAGMAVIATIGNSVCEGLNAWHRRRAERKARRGQPKWTTARKPLI